MKELFHARSLRVSFLKAKVPLLAVKDACFSLHKGETVALVGESGCGKSALGKAIMRLLPEKIMRIEGEMWLGSTPLHMLNERDMRKIRGQKIGMIFQDPMSSLNPTMRIGDQIIEGLLLQNPRMHYKDAWQRALELLELVGILEPEKRIKDYPYALSGGMRQRVMIAIALSGSPELLIADEPTTSLDVTIQAQILQLLKEIQQKIGMSILLITHDMSVVAGFADRILVMYAGKLVEKGSAEQIFFNPSHPYTKKLLKAIPRIDQAKNSPLSPILGAPPSLEYMPTGCPFHPRCPAAKKNCSIVSPPRFLINQPLEMEHEVTCWEHDQNDLAKGLFYE